MHEVATNSPRCVPRARVATIPDALPPARGIRPMTSTRREALDPRTPVIVGVGVASQQLDEPGSGLEALELMLASARTAGEDTGAPGILRAVQRVAVPH